MTTKRSMIHSRSRRILGLWIAAACICIVLSLSLVYGRVSAGQAGRPQWLIPPSARSAGPGDIQQELIVEVEVDVLSEQDVALLQSLGYACGVGVCKLELREGEELALSRLGLTVRVMARAIKLSAGSENSDAIASPQGEHAVYGADWTNHDIADQDPRSQSCGFGLTWFEISGAPAGATVSRVKYTTRIVHQHVGDLIVYMGPVSNLSLKVWDRWGHDTDESLDDDPEDDADVQLIGRETTYYNGETVNQHWELFVYDCAWWNTGYIDYWYIYVYYWVCESADLPAAPSAPSPANGATGVNRDHNLDWDDAAQATSYHVYFGTDIHFQPWLGSTNVSNINPSPLSSSTHYYWMVVAKNACGSTNGPLWDFTTACIAPATPSLVSPANSATGVHINAALDWETASGATSYDVFFGTTNPPPWRGNTTCINYPPGPLSYNTHYYWKIVAMNDCGNTSGLVWDFTTQGDGSSGKIYLPVIRKQ